MPKVQRRNFENYAVQNDSEEPEVKNGKKSEKESLSDEQGKYGPGDETWAARGPESASPTGGNSREQNNESYYEQSDGRTNQYGQPKRAARRASDQDEQRTSSKTTS